MLADVNWWLTILPSFTALIRLTFKKSCSHAILHYVEVVPLVSMNAPRLPFHIISRVLLCILQLLNVLYSSSTVKFGPLSWPAYSFKSHETTTQRYRLRIQAAHRIPACIISSSFIRILIKQIYKFMQPAYSKANWGGLYDFSKKKKTSIIK